MRVASMAWTVALLMGCVTTPSELLKDGAVREKVSARTAAHAALCISRNLEERALFMQPMRLAETEVPGTHEFVARDMVEGGFIVFRTSPAGSGSLIRMYFPHWPAMHYEQRFIDLTSDC